MSQRILSEEEVEARLKTFGGDLTAVRVVLFLKEQLDRARSEEARLLEENRAKDATIRALADALEAAARHVPLRDVPLATQIHAALRLVGRL